MATKKVPIGAVESEPLVFELEVSAKVTHDDVRWLGEHVWREGPERRFVYVAIGKLASDAASPWERRMRIEVDKIGPRLVVRKVNEPECNRLWGDLLCALHWRIWRRPLRECLTVPGHPRAYQLTPLVGKVEPVLRTSTPAICRRERAMALKVSQSSCDKSRELQNSVAGYS